MEDGCSSYWYSRFTIGCKRRMGQDWRPNKAFSTALLLSYLKSIEDKIWDSETMEDFNRWIVLGAYSVITYVVSLRGSEGFLLERGSFCEMLTRPVSRSFTQDETKPRQMCNHGVGGEESRGKARE
jgi:hypothetical protein